MSPLHDFILEALDAEGAQSPVSTSSDTSSDWSPMRWHADRKQSGERPTRPTFELLTAEPGTP